MKLRLRELVLSETSATDGNSEFTNHHAEKDFFLIEFRAVLIHKFSIVLRPLNKIESYSEWRPFPECKPLEVLLER